MSTQRRPQEIQRIQSQGLSITWSDQTQCQISARLLRKNCPCAHCRHERGDTSHEKPLSGKASMLRVVEHSEDEQLELKRIWAVGQYALGIEWGDGHTDGIYTFEFLAKLCSEQNA